MQNGAPLTFESAPDRELATLPIGGFQKSSVVQPLVKGLAADQQSVSPVPPEVLGGSEWRFRLQVQVGRPSLPA